MRAPTHIATQAPLRRDRRQGQADHVQPGGGGRVHEPLDGCADNLSEFSGRRVRLRNSSAPSHPVRGCATAARLLGLVRIGPDPSPAQRRSTGHPKETRTPAALTNADDGWQQRSRARTLVRPAAAAINERRLRSTWAQWQPILSRKVGRPSSQRRPSASGPSPTHSVGVCGLCDHLLVSTP